jgi:hypothetical protein
VDQRLFPVVEPASKPSTRYLADARSAVRRARERALTAAPTPTSLRARSPAASPSVSQHPRTITDVPRGRVAQPLPPHGTRARYNARHDPCRCASCKLANRAYMRSYRQAGPDGPRPGSVSIATRVAETRVSARYL